MGSEFSKIRNCGVNPPVSTSMGMRPFVSLRPGRFPSLFCHALDSTRIGAILHLHNFDRVETIQGTSDGPSLLSSLRDEQPICQAELWP